MRTPHMCSASPCPLHAACAVPRRRQCKAPRAERFVTARAEASSASDAASDPVSTAERDAEGAERPSEDASSSPDELALLTTAGQDLSGKVPWTDSEDFPDLSYSNIDQERFTIDMHEGRFLVALDERTDMLFTNDILYEDDHGVRQRAVHEGPPIPPTGARYQLIPWTQIKTSDTLKWKQEELKVEKMFMIRKMHASDDLDLKMVITLDSQKRSATLSEVEVRCDPEVPAEKRVLRIREDGLYLESNWQKPNPGQVVQAHMDEEKNRVLTPEEQEEQLRELMEKIGEREEDLEPGQLDADFD
eukprot:CAMPEP_0206142592 /NCGR_PEP_ID=MMETSP1473-20131121/17515_1 /ASSEMBLY_ACC=CAM_ASM_001109 /TAXON_ID=1461547 /ORGANISM="Stichococcus sp, Strain RCC1054" /LENGTH=302 /DNA_ID=CAMNT_0053537645 /DNA_START=141 /DNA_END=1049 /DNA_ORIENTATION=+